MTKIIQTAILNTFRAGQISRTAKDVLLIIARSMRPASYESLARAAKCSRRSVAYAIQQAEQLGILCRSHNRIRRGRRWMNGCNGYRFIMRAITERLAFPWRRSQCKACTTSNEEIKNNGQMPHSPDEYRRIWERMVAGLTIHPDMKEVTVSGLLNVPIGKTAAGRADKATVRECLQKLG